MSDVASDADWIEIIYVITFLVAGVTVMRLVFAALGLRSYGWPGMKPGRLVFPFLPPRTKPGTSAMFLEINKKTALINEYLSLVQ